MKERPMLMTTDMVKQAKGGRKDETRRIRDLDYINSLGSQVNFVTCCEATEMTYNQKVKPGYAAFFGNKNTDEWFQPIYSPYGAPGDVLYVRETWQMTYNRDKDKWEYIFKADGCLWYEDDGPIKWKPNIHMKKEAARLWLLVKDVRVERLQDIDGASAINEGIQEFTKDGVNVKYGLPTWDWYDMPREPRAAFFRLFDSINHGIVEQNPWVWVVKFRVLSTTGKPSNLEELCAAR